MKIIVKLKGGLGNQMFQYAFGKEISLLTNRELILDLSSLIEENPNIVKRDFDLTIFNINGYQVVDSFDEPCEKFFEDWYPEIWGVEYFNIIKEKILSSVHNNVYIDGYWQTPILFSEKFEPLVDFSFKNSIINFSEPISKDIKNCNSVMVNVRRKDFVDNNFHGCYGVDFIKKSIDFLQSEEKNLHFFIFSDDIDWCEKNLSFIENSTVIGHSHSGEKFGNYLQLMTQCKHFILPNSTFAFWAAFISQNINKKIVRPKIWFKYQNLECDFLFETLNYNKIDCIFN